MQGMIYTLFRNEAAIKTHIKTQKMQFERNNQQFDYKYTLDSK